MPQPTFVGSRVDSVQLLREEARAFADDVTEMAGAVDLGDFTIGTSETKVSHGLDYAPRWWPCNVRGLALIGQSRAPDASFLYLYASATVTAGLWVV